jgi:hypothetical protein
LIPDTADARPWKEATGNPQKTVLDTAHIQMPLKQQNVN